MIKCTRFFVILRLEMPMNTPLLTIRRPIEPELSRYSALFDAVLTHDERFMDRVLEHVRSRKGKMMRPILVLLMAKECGAVDEKALRCAVTLELLHTASLVHDDVVDESPERRGQASLRAVFDNKVAVLLGDYMLARSLHQAALTGKVEIVEQVAALGATLSEGEIFQLANVESATLSEEAYFRIIRNKTSALFATCGLLGALAQDSDGEFCQTARRFGEIVGLCFQIRDDIFDYFDDAAIGKPRGNDMAEGKLTLPAIYAVNHTGDARAAELARRVKALKATREEMAELIAFAKANGGIEYAREAMEKLRNEAELLLGHFRNDAVRESLKAYIDFVIGRDY